MEKKEFRKKLLSLVLPITFQQLMLAVVSASDALMVGAIGQDLLSAVSLASQVTFVYNLFLAALTIGTSMFAAQYWGKRDYASVEKILGIVLRTSLAVSLLFFVGATFLPGLLMRIFTTDPVLIRHGVRYLRIVGITYLLCGVSQIYLCIMKNSGLATRSMVIGSAAAALNLVLNAVLIYGLFGAPRMEAAGAASGDGDLTGGRAALGFVRTWEKRADKNAALLSQASGCRSEKGFLALHPPGTGKRIGLGRGIYHVLGDHGASGI